MEKQRPPITAKKVIGWSFLGCGGVLALVVAVAGVGIWRANSALDQRKTEIIPLVAKFTDCFYRDDTACVKSITTWDDAVLSSASAMAGQTKERLGARGKALPIDKSWTIRTFKSVAGGTTVTVRMALDVAYENDPKATELFELVDEGHGFRVTDFRVSSPRIFVDPKKAL